MDSQNSKINVLVVGATGNLGTYITKHCLTHPNLIVNILVRDPQKNKELSNQIEQAGGKVIKGDVTQPETLKGTTKGMHTVIFALSFEENVLLHGQIALIDDCVANGVERVIPTDYSENFSKFSQEELDHVPFVVNKFKVRQHLESLPIKTLRIDGGLFIETFYKTGKELGYWGDANHKFQLTSYEDTARFIAAAVARKDQSGHLVFAGNEVTINEIAEIYNKVRGTNIVPKKLGSLDDLKAQAEALEKVNNPNSYFLRFLALIFDERSRFDKVNNSEFPELKATSIEELLKQKPEVVVPL